MKRILPLNLPCVAANWCSPVTPPTALAGVPLRPADSRSRGAPKSWDGRLSLCLAVLLIGVSAPAAIIANWDSGFANGGAILDGDLTGWQDTRTLSVAPGQTIADLNVTLNLSGGNNGDLYAYLVHETGFSILLNRVGRTASNPMGYDNTGFGPTAGGEAFRLDDQAGSDVHGYQLSYALNTSGQLTGTWQPDGRNIHPLSAGLTFDTATRDARLDSFNGLDPNGSWTLYIADVTSGGGQSTVQSWGLEVTAVPEAPPLGAAAMLLFYALVHLIRQRRSAKA
jgi:subtilisin-like proprotein convertase family protein